MGKYVKIDDLQAFCDNQVTHSITPNDILRMSSYDLESFAAQGWQCPVCKRVYSPTTPMCWYCGDDNKKVTTTNTTTGEQHSTPVLDYMVNPMIGDPLAVDKNDQ